MPDFWERLLQGFLGTLVFGASGIILLALGFKVFDWLTPKLDIEKELSEKHNVAVAIVCAALLLGLSYLIATAVH